MNQAKVNCNCPQCQQIDQVQKISAIYTAGLSTSKVTGHLDTDLIGTRVQLKGQNQTYLSKKFIPPKRPAADIINGGVIGCLGTVLILSGILTIYAIVINSGYLIQMTAPIFVYMVPIFIVFFIVWWQGRRATPTFQERLSHWQGLCDIWNGTYYCHRCHIVYHPDQSDQVYSVENAHQLYKFPIRR